MGIILAGSVKDRHFTLARHRVSSSSVVTASGLIMEGRGFKSHLELGFFFFFLSSFQLMLFLSFNMKDNQPNL